jgi:hypothetical protein
LPHTRLLSKGDVDVRQILQKDPWQVTVRRSQQTQLAGLANGVSRRSNVAT